jgi:hypothetical protein
MGTNMLWRRKGLLTACVAVALGITVLEGHTTQPHLLSPDPRHHVITDPGSGLALFGYDPVAYHNEHAARPGLAIHEARFDDRVWRFVSAANKAAFEADPLVYIPLFGGHDGHSVGNGTLTKGDPANFVLIGGRLVLFRTEKDRDLFAADSAIRQKARENWPQLVRQLAGH